jgi:2-octaprenyl-6-methoxyphenol hydroxylase
VPLPGNVSSIVWVEKDEDIPTYLSLKKQDLERAIQDRSLDALGRVTLMTDPQSWPLVTLTAQKLIAPRMALAGEAAHAFSPIGAQGLNLSLRDVAVLAEILTDSARLGEDIGNLFVLSRYQSRRQTDIQTRTWGVNNLNRMVSNDTEFLRGLRRTGLKTLARFPALRQVMMKEGLSPLTGHIRLMQESAL